MRTKVLGKDERLFTPETFIVLTDNVCSCEECSLRKSKELKNVNPIPGGASYFL